MDDKMKQRAVGAVVLLSLAIIFVPMFLDFDKSTLLSDRDTVIPPLPEGEVQTITIPMRDQLADTRIEDVKPQRPVYDEEPVASAAPEEKPRHIAEAKSLETPAAKSEPAKPAATPPAPPPVVKAAPATATKPSESPATAPAREAGKPAPIVTAKPELVRPSSPARAWAVQVGSFSQRKNAEALREKLVKKGYRAFVATTRADGKTVVRVRIGPELLRSEADRIKTQIEKDFRLQAMVIQHR